MEQTQPLGSARVVLWDPKGSNRFVVGGGGELRMYEYNHEKSEFKHNGLRSDLQSMRCFAWSPHSVYNDLLAVGMQSGTVEICRLDQPIPTTLTSLSTMQRPVSLSVSMKNRRPCTSLAFSALNPNLLANGLDKFRSEYSLIIWDLQQSAPTFEASLIDDHFDNITEPLPNPSGLSNRLARHPMNPQARSTTSSGGGTISGRPNEPHQLSTRGTPNLRKQVQDQSNPYGQYCPAEGINSCVFQTRSSWEVVAGVYNRLIRYFDLRVPTKAVREALTKAVRGICCDPLDGNLIASLDESGVHIWDRRNHTQPILVFQEEDAGFDVDVVNALGNNHLPSSQKISGVEFCNTRRGVIGTTTREGNYVRLWDVIGNSTFDDYHNNDASDTYSEQTSSHAQGEWAANQGSWTESRIAPSEGLRRGSASDDQTLVLASTRRTKLLTKAVASFDFVPRSAAPTSAPHVVAVSKGGDIELSVVRDSPRHQWSSRGDLAASSGRRYKLYKTHGGMESDSNREPWDLPIDENKSPANRPTVITQDDEAPLGRDIEHHTALNGLKSSPSPALRSSTLTDKKGGAGSAVSTPRPSLTPLESDESSGIPGKARATTPTKTPIKSLKGLSQSRARSSRRPERHSTEKDLSQDISAVIRRRVLHGYGLESARHNSDIVLKEDSETTKVLSDVWLWLHTSNKVLQAENALMHVHGFDFTLKGVLPVWEGFQSLSRLAVDSPSTSAQWQATQRGRRTSSALSATAPRGIVDKKFGNYVVAVEWLNKRNTDSRVEPITLPSSSKKHAQRQLGLSLVGWNHSDAEMELQISGWERAGSAARAACWALFMGKTERAIEILGRSKDERNRLLSTTIAGLQLQNGGDSSVFASWRDRCQKMAARLDDPYGRMLLTWFITHDWRESTQDIPIDLQESIAIALRFFDDAEVSDFLKEKVKSAIEEGELDGLILTGINEDGIRILQTYTDHTGDVQTAAIMGALSPSLYVQDKNTQRKRSQSTSIGFAGYFEEQTNQQPTNLLVAEQIEGWFNAYAELLDGWKLFHYRAQFDMDKGQLVMIAMSPRHSSNDPDGSFFGEMASGLMEPVDWMPRQLELRCQVCGTSIGVSGPKMMPEVPTNTATVAACPKCSKRLPRCAVCRMYMSFPGDPAEKLLHNPLHDTMDESLVFCQTCRHGGHASHVLGWFFGASTANGQGRKHDTCPVAGCECHCVDE